MKFCKDCKHFEEYEKDITLSSCHGHQVVSLLDGTKSQHKEAKYADTNRNFKHLCGFDAKWFEAKDANPV